MFGAILLFLSLAYILYNTRFFIKPVKKTIPYRPERLMISHTAYPNDIHNEIDPNLAQYDQKAGRIIRLQ